MRCSRCVFSTLHNQVTKQDKKENFFTDIQPHGTLQNKALCFDKTKPTKRRHFREICCHARFSVCLCPAGGIQETDQSQTTQTNSNITPVVTVSNTFYSTQYVVISDQTDSWGEYMNIAGSFSSVFIFLLCV